MSFIFTTELYCFEVRLELSDVRIPASSLVVLPCLCLPPMPPPSQWPAFITLPPLAKFQLVWRRLCEALLSSSSLARQNHSSLLPRIVCNVEKYKVRFARSMNIKLSNVFADTVDALTATFAV